VKIAELQQSIREVDQQRFPKAPSYLALIKCQEELGELSDAYISHFETREGKETGKDMGQEAADVIISLITFCEREGINIEEAIKKKWDIVIQRNYKLINVERNIHDEVYWSEEQQREHGSK